MNIAGTGLSGLVGSRIVDILSKKYSFENWSLETGVDITDKQSLENCINASSASWIFHFAAYTDVQGAEVQKSQGLESIAWKVNVRATEHIVELCQKSGKHVLYIDTDYAFDGNKKSYSEEDTPNPQGWYAQTKTEGAKRVVALGTKGLIIRISNPYRASPVGQATQPGKTDFVHKMLARLQGNQKIIAPSDQLFVPTFIDDIAQAIDKLVSIEANGIYHVVGSQAVSPYETGKIIARTYGLDEALVAPTTFAQYFKDRAPAPQYAVLKNDKIHRLGISMHTFESGMQQVKKQELQK
jgi:dTDP-4-dehydrorhamnose reductase